MRKYIHEYTNTNFSDRLVNEEKETKGEKADYSGLYKRVQTRLENDLWNHAAVMRRLNWDGDESTNRSLFEKKLSRAENDSGGNYTFSQEELEKIISILDSATK